MGVGVALTALLVVACGHAASTATPPAPTGAMPSGMAGMPAVGSPDPAAYGSVVQRGYARVRSATEPFKSLDAAVAAGYEKNVPQCYTDSLHVPSHGAMGYHHINRAYVDRDVDLDKPEILLYERRADGSYALNGVEFLVPYRFWPKDSVPPRLLGRDMQQENERNYWYSHLWVWNRNSAGLFADWNPAVTCR